MHAIILAITGVFIVANVAVEWRNRKTMVWWQNPLSAYLAGVPYAKVQSVAYLLFSIGMLLMAWSYGRVVPAILLIASAVSLANVVYTKWEALRKPQERAAIMKEHVLSAGIAFITATLALLFLAWQANWAAFALALAAPLSALLFWKFEPAQTTLEEKTYLALLLASFVVLLA